MTRSPDISVVINNYNYGQFVGQAIESALDQKDVKAEVIVVDDGSTDNSGDVIRGFGSAVRAHFQPNGGQARAINSGVAMAEAPILAFLDADDWFLPGKLLSVLDAFESSPKAGIVYHRLQPVYSDGSPAFSAIPRSLCQGDLGPRLQRSGGRWPFPMTSSLAVRQSLWRNAGNIPGDFSISADAWITGILPMISPVIALPRPLACYRIHNNAWFRAQDDAGMLARRMAHWEHTVRITNTFLSSRQMRGRVMLRDHFDYQVAAARLGRPGALRPLELARLGLGDAGEPNVLRRLRAILGAMTALRQDRTETAGQVDTS